MLLRSNLLSYPLCRADAVSDERSESITKFSPKVFNDLRDFKENNVGTAEPTQ